MSTAPGRYSVVLISQTYPPVIGGSEMEAQRVSAGLLRRGHRVQVVCRGGAPMPAARDWVDAQGVPVRQYGRRGPQAWRDWVLAVRTAAMLVRERRQYQVVYFLMQGLQLALCLPVARALGKPIIMKVSGSGVLPLLQRSATGRQELRWLRRWAARLLILNDGMRQEATACGFAAQQVSWMPNPIDTVAFAPAAESERQRLRQQSGLAPQAFVVLYSGRLAPEKGLPLLLAGFAAVARQHPEAVLVVVGDGAMRAELEQQAAGLGLGPEQIHFAGRVAPEQVAAWLQLADVFALTSPAEGFSCALAEAMAIGLACLACDIPANRQLIASGENGILVTSGDRAAVAAGLETLLASPELRRRIGLAARAHIVARYTLDQVVEKYETLFREVLPAPPELAAQAAPSRGATVRREP